MSLSGVRVALTASRDRSEAISFLLEDEGAEILHLPLLELRPPEDPRPFAATVEHLSRYPKILLSSLEAVIALWDGARVAATTEALARADLIATDAAVARLLTALGRPPWLDLSTGAPLRLDADTEVLVPMGAFDPTWPRALAEAGALAIAVLGWTPAPVALPEQAPQLIVFDGPGAASALQQKAPAWLAAAKRVAATPATAAELAQLGAPAHALATGGSVGLLDAAQVAWTSGARGNA